ncbi:hypothetical protein [Rothia nasimurium]|uniref:arsenate reductase/protein-tyrosine-phosphatase family protein n=1 Tax=Rothia nasimurium TaxID=85336 RepID=UPI001F15FE9C|nr:hypothetical protein [Rothia nasimurium]
MVQLGFGSFFERILGKGRHDQDIAPKKQVLFVGTSNTTSSAAAQYLAQELSQPSSGWSFASAGIKAQAGAGINPDVAQALFRLEIETSAHQASQVERARVVESALILTMTEQERAWLHREFPRYRDKIHLLGQMARLQHRAGKRVDPVAFMKQLEDAPVPDDSLKPLTGKGLGPAEDLVRDLEDALATVVPWLGR